MLEIDASVLMARRASPTPLPVDFLRQSLPLFRYTEETRLSVVLNYWQAVLRYNGRVARIIAYGSGKRAAGESPGSEDKPERHAEEVLSAAPSARNEVSHLASQHSRRLAGTG